MRYYNTKRDGSNFGPEIVEAVWQKALSDPRYPGYKADRCGAWMQRGMYGKREKYGWEIDHIIPVAHNGTDDLSNLQPLYWETNCHKGDALPGQWSCPV